MFQQFLKNNIYLFLIIGDKKINKKNKILYSDKNYKKLNLTFKIIILFFYHK